MTRLVLVTLAVVTIASAWHAAASTLGGVPGGVGAGGGVVAPCDTTGVTVTYTTSGGNVTAGTVAGLADPACEAGELSLTLTDAGGQMIAEAEPTPIPGDADTTDNQLTVQVTPSPAAEQVAGYDVSIAGP